jgi:hypothetical protein
MAFRFDSSRGGETGGAGAVAVIEVAQGSQDTGGRNFENRAAIIPGAAVEVAVPHDNHHQCCELKCYTCRAAILPSHGRCGVNRQPGVGVSAGCNGVCDRGGLLDADRTPTNWAVPGGTIASGAPASIVCLPRPWPDSRHRAYELVAA